MSVWQRIRQRRLAFWANLWGKEKQVSNLFKMGGRIKNLKEFSMAESILNTKSTHFVFEFVVGYSSGSHRESGDNLHQICGTSTRGTILHAVIKPKATSERRKRRLIGIPVFVMAVLFFLVVLFIVVDVAAAKQQPLGCRIDGKAQPTMSGVCGSR